jgi:hypothetical protein
MCLGMCLPVGRTKGEALYVHRSSMASVREKTCNTHFLNKWLQDLWIIIGSIAAFFFDSSLFGSELRTEGKSLSLESFS